MTTIHRPKFQKDLKLFINCSSELEFWIKILPSFFWPPIKIEKRVSTGKVHEFGYRSDSQCAHYLGKFLPNACIRRIINIILQGYIYPHSPVFDIQNNIHINFSPTYKRFFHQIRNKTPSMKIDTIHNIPLTENLI